MFFEFLQAVVTLDLNWLAWLFFANFHYLFAFIAVLFIFFDGKTKTIITGFVLFCGLSWAMVDFNMVSGWVLFVGTFLAINYIAKLAILTFAEADAGLSKHLLVINMVSFFAMWSIYNLFLV